MRRVFLAVGAFFLAAATTNSAAGDPEVKSIPGIGPIGEVVRLHTGFKFTEGPAADANGNVYFTDIPNNRIHKSDSKGQLSTLLEKSDACNGLMFDARGRLLACQGALKRLIAIDTGTTQITPLADKCEDKPLGTPNDLVVDRQGGVYFTAPDTQSVYYVDAAGRVVRLPMKLARPNGVILSPDEKTLYVLPSGSADVMAYPLISPGKAGDGKVFCTLIPNPKQPGRPGGDGLTIDTKGNLYLTRPSMKLIQVVAPDGKTLGFLHLPEEPANCTFGGVDMKTLYVTAQTSLYTIKMEATGHRFAVAPPSGPLPEAWRYDGPMKNTAAKFHGQEGVVIHIGGSMTIANPYGTWARSGKGKTPEDLAILKWMHTEKKDKTDGWWLCRTEVEHYRAYTSESGLKSAMLFAGGKRGLPALEKMLDEYKPQMVTIECGIYDIEDGVPLDDYRKHMGKALDAILDRGAIPILNTIPPFKVQLERTRQFNDALRSLAKDRGIPIIDLEREILTRRPDDWFGKLMNRIHLTAGEAGGSPAAEPTAENLQRSGYLLRGWLTVRKIAEVKQRVLDNSAPRMPEPKSLPQEPNTWFKRSPSKNGPPSPGLSYETSLGYDPVARRVIRWGGHAQGGIKGSGEQIAELWTFDPVSMKWEHKEPNRSPPASCCVQQNVFDTAQNRFLRFKAAGGNHGWQWYREIYLNNTSVWSYDLATNTWRDMRPLPEPPLSLLHPASWDSDHQVAVVFGGEGTREGTLVYDPHVNTWSRMEASNEPPQGSKESPSGGNLAYDAARKLHILFGSQFTDDPHTWGYDLRKNAWRDLKPAALPPTNRNDAVLAYDSINQINVAIVRVAENENKAHLETWSYDAGKNAWTRMNVLRQPDAIGGRSRVMTYVSDQNFFLLDCYVKPVDRVADVEREHQIWTYRYAESKPNPAPLAPTGLQIITTADGAILKWQASPSAELTEYVVYRGEGAQPWLVDYRSVGRVTGMTLTYHDAGLKPGAVYFYCVRAVAKDGRESSDSLKVRTQPRVVEDTVVSVMSPKEVRLTWRPPMGSDIAGYHVERAVVEVFSEDEVQRLKKDTPPLAEPSVGAIKDIGVFRRITKEMVKTTSYVDTTLDLTQPQSIEGAPLPRTSRLRGEQLDSKGKAYRYAVFAYRIRAINALGVESGPSPYFLTIPSAPQHLFSREDDEKCHLKWAANPELGLKGYRVYWMKGPRPEGPGQATHRLTDEPTKETRFTDDQAGKEPRRFWVVAVDALGQEGIPSSPTWHYRTQRSFYIPFVGEWHQ